MPTLLPDCVRCDASATLGVVSIDPGGVRVCECSCCSTVMRIASDGSILHVWPEPTTDVSGRSMYE